MRAPAGCRGQDMGISTVAAHWQPLVPAVDGVGASAYHRMAQMLSCKLSKDMLGVTMEMDELAEGEDNGFMVVSVLPVLQ